MHPFLFAILATVAAVAFLIWIPSAVVSAFTRALVRFWKEESR